MNIYDQVKVIQRGKTIPFYQAGYNLVFLDTETTGLDPYKHEIVEFGMIDWQGKESHWLIKPNNLQNASPRALEINGYNQDRWANEGISSTEFYQLVKPKLNRAIIVCSNPHFDLGFLRALYNQEGDGKVNWHYKPICIGAMFTAQMSLIAGQHQIADHYSVDVPERHRALVDAKVCKSVFEKIIEDAICA